jgi:hypothetical protein
LVSGREIVALRPAYRQAGRERTCGLARTRNAVLPTCLPTASLDAERRCATTSAAAWSVELRVPIRRSRPTHALYHEVAFVACSPFDEGQQLKELRVGGHLVVAG